MYTKEELESMDTLQLMGIAEQLGVKVSPDDELETVVYAILDKAAEESAMSSAAAPKRKRTRIVKKDTSKVYTVNGKDGENFDLKNKQGKPADDGTETQAEGDGTTEGEEPTVYPYATMSAVITDGTRCQDPAPADASTANIVAKAQNNTIESNGAEWQHLVVPFDYDTYAANDITGKAILVTFSTNATPGQGSTNPDDRDELYVDDLELVYNAGLNKLAYNGTDIELQDGTYEYTIEDLNATEVTADQIEAVSDGRGAYVATSVNETQTGFRAVTIVTSNDFKTTNTYTLYINNVSTGIENVETDADNATEAIYTIGGQRVNELQKGVNIVRKANGTTVKVLKK